jgi:hypothetical protein
MFSSEKDANVNSLTKPRILAKGADPKTNLKSDKNDQPIESFMDVVETSNDAVDQIKDVVVTSYDVLESSNDVLETSNYAVETSNNVFEMSKDVLETGNDVDETSNDVQETGKGVICLLSKTNGGLIKDVESKRLIYFYRSDIRTISRNEDPKQFCSNFNIGKVVYYNAILLYEKVNIT